MINEAGDPRRRRALSPSPGWPATPAAIFDAAADRVHGGALSALGFDVVARPGEPLGEVPQPGDRIIRRALGEGQLALWLEVEGEPDWRTALEARGVRCEGSDDGLFVEVSGGGGDQGLRRALRIVGLDGLTRSDTLLVRPYATPRVAAAEDDLDPDLDLDRDGGPSVPPAAYDDPGAPEPALLAAPALPSARPVGDDADLAAVLASTYALRSRRRPRLREDLVRGLIEARGPGAAPPLAADVQRARAQLARRSNGLRPGTQAHTAVLEDVAGTLLAAAERNFVLDPSRSTLELLEPAARDRFLRFAWHPDDFPGGPRGPHEGRAAEMFAALVALRPERRPNAGPDALLTEPEAGGAAERRILAGLTTVPATGGMRLHREAAEAFGRMRAAAAANGVSLVIGDSFRTPARARARAARAGNSVAVARFSAHSLGVAIDLLMSVGRLTFVETATRPFQLLVDMYRAPVHKWMFLRGDEFGFFPYRAEPWHWEYNPPGFRDRFRAAPLPASAARRPTTDPQAQAPALPARNAPVAAPGPVPDEGVPSNPASLSPLVAPRPPLVIRRSVGKGGLNLAGDVRAVQGRLIELRELDPADAAAERPADDAANATEASLSHTIAAIERFQRERGRMTGGAVEPAGDTRADLDRAIPRPTAADFAEVARQRAALEQTATRGLTLRGPVGATATGNAADDVRAVQRRLVRLGKLSAQAAAAEAPPATAVTVSQAALVATIVAIRAVQPAAHFWAARDGASGALTNGVVAPGDATAALLDRITTYETRAGDARFVFSDHVVDPQTRAPGGVAYAGVATPTALPAAVYRGAGLDDGQAAALRQVSASEGNFDAVNTYDRAVVSVGFIQFAGGGRGLGPYLALLKLRHPREFRDLLQRFGIDVEVGVGSDGRFDWTRVLVLDPAGARVLGGAEAEGAIRDDKRLTAAMVLSGRERAVQSTQIEAAVRDYVRPVLDATIAWGRTRAPIRELIRSRTGLAVVIDRAVQEGPLAARRRVERVVRTLAATPAGAPAAGRPAPLTLRDLQVREGDVLATVERDLQAAANAAAAIARARDALRALEESARAAAATVPSLLARGELADARRAVGAARLELEEVLNVTPAGRETHETHVTMESTLAAMKEALKSEMATLAVDAPPASSAELGEMFARVRARLATVGGPLAPSAVFLRRIQRIRRSGLDSTLTESIDPLNVAERFLRPGPMSEGDSPDGART